MSVKKVNSDDPRILAVQTLSRVKNGAYSNLQLNQVIKRHQLATADKALLTTLVYGVIQYRLTLKYWLSAYIQGKKIDDWVKELLYTALFQWHMLDRVPKHAVFNETIEVAKKMGHVGTARFVTAILHKMDREGLPDINAITDPIKQLSIQYSVPTWLITSLQAQVGVAKTERILKSINLPPHQSIRVNQTKATDEQVIEVLTKAGYQVTASQIAPHAFEVSGGHVASSQAFQDGWLTLQDESAMLPVESLQLKGQDLVVLDAAAAPGGKTTQIADELGPNGRVIALDIHEHKVRLIQDNARRLGISNKVTTQMLDARRIPVVLSEDFDRILVDAPCSGLGLLRRKPEIRYEKTLIDVENLAKLQSSILDAASQRLKKNGIMVYSTCTILHEENDDVIQDFLKQHPDFELIPSVTNENIDYQPTELGLHIYPDDYQTDGFFIATLRRKE